MPLTDEEAMALVALHGANWHYSPDPVSDDKPGYAVWDDRTDEGSRPWRELCRPTFGEACKDYCKRHGLGQVKV